MSATLKFPAGAARATDAPARRLDLGTPGFADRFGDRLLIFDHATATSLEVLRFKPEFSESLTFEAVLRDRVEQLRGVEDPSIVPARAVEHAAGEGLLLISRQAAGQRLSELPARARGPVFAVEFIRHIAPMLALLAEGRRFAHGALSLDRVVMSHEGKLLVVEAALGAAAESLGWPASRVQSELGLAVPAGMNPNQFDGRIDVVQLGFVALSLLLGRRLNPADYPANVATLLDESAQAEGGGTWAASRLRSWLERAMQIGPRPLQSARDAQLSLSELPAAVEFSQTDSHRTTAAAQPTPAPPRESSAVPPRESAPEPARQSAPPSPQDVAANMARAFAPAVPKPAPRAAAPVAAQPAMAATAKPTVKKTSRTRARPWALLAVSALAVVEALAIGGLMYFRPKPLVLELRPPVVLAMAPPTLPAAAAVNEATSGPQVAALVTPPPAPAVAAAGDSAVRGAEQFGGINLSSPIELQVYEAGSLIGSTSSPIAIVQGVHTLDLVNDALGYRSRQTLTVKPGQLAARAVAIPNGRLSINAVPWADVWIDGSPAGQTPLANLSIPIGQHDVVFRHPQFAEQRQTAVVKSEGLARVSANMQR